MAKKSTSKKSSSPKIPAHVDSNSSVEVRQIQNGFIVRESGYTGKGRNQQYYNKEWFSASNPVKVNGGGGLKFGKK